MAIAPLLGAFFGVGVTVFKNSLCYLPCEPLGGRGDARAPDRGWAGPQQGSHGPTAPGVRPGRLRATRWALQEGAGRWCGASGAARRSSAPPSLPCAPAAPALTLSPGPPPAARRPPRAGYRKPWEHVIAGTAGAYAFTWVADKEVDMVKQIEEYYARAAGKQQD
jgi:hypothetical protein